MTFAGYDEQEIAHRERLFALPFLLFLVFATLFDLYEDLQDGAPFSHLAGELLIVALAMAAGGYLWWRITRGWKRHASHLVAELKESRRAADHWKAEADKHSAELSEAVRRQMIAWGLSDAESEVAFMLIQGLSTKEIATARATSERTVRQQAVTIYRKSGVEGRAQLAAYFLEALFVARGGVG